MALTAKEKQEYSARIDALRSGFAGHRQNVRIRNAAYLRAYSPPFEAALGEHDQWTDPIEQKDDGRFRASFNLARAVVDLWAALEMSEFPVIRWEEGYLPLPPPSMNLEENEAREQSYQAAKLVARTMATMREQMVGFHIRRSKLVRHAYRAVRKKNLYGHSWMKVVPDVDTRTFRAYSKIDPSTVYPVWSGFEDDRLDAILCATRRSAAAVNRQYPGMVEMNKDGITLHGGLDGYYNPTNEAVTDADLAFVWVEDYWTVDAEWVSQPSDDGETARPVRSRVINVIRVAGKVAEVTEYPGWRRVPYVLWQNENDRDQLGFSDVGTVLPIQDMTNRFMSEQADVIHGESRPKFKYRGDADREITINEGEIVSLEPDEDLEQIAVHLDVFPTQVHGQQMLELLARIAGLPDTVWGRITAAQNSGRALATAWRAVAARMVPRTHGNAGSLEWTIGMMVDWMELYGWQDAGELYQGNRDFELDFPNQEPRDFAEITLNALNRLQAGLIDEQKAMEETGEKSPDEMLDRVRRSYMDPVMHPDKAQAYLFLQRIKNQIAIEMQQAGMAAEAQALQMAQLANSAPAGAPGPGTVDQQAGAVRQAGVQAQQQGAPVRAEDQQGPAPATQAGSPGNSTKVSTLVQDGQAFNRGIIQGEI